MLIHEAALNLIEKEIDQLATAWSERIVHSNLSHADYLVAKTTYNVLKDVTIIVNKAVTLDPDKPLPETFIPSVGTPVQEMTEQSSEPNIHTVDIETGTVSHGSN